MEAKKCEKRYRRHKRVRAKIFGTARRPRLCVFRSSKHIYAQLIDDEKRQTLAAASDMEIKSAKRKAQSAKSQQKTPVSANQAPAGSQNLKEKKEEIIRIGKIATAYEVGKLIAKKALAKKIEKAVFDRGGYKYHGRIKTLSDGAREGGLKF